MGAAEDLRAAAAARLLGIAAPGREDAPLRVVSVSPIDRPGWRIELGGTAIPATTIHLEPADTPQPSLIRTSHLALGVMGEGLDPVLHAWLVRLASRLEGVTWPQVHRWLDNGVTRAVRQPADDAGGSLDTDPGRGTDAPSASGIAAAAIGSRPGPRRRCPPLNVAWNHPDAWSRYLADDELEGGRDGVVQYRIPMVRLEHGDLECQFVQARGFTVRPWETVDGGSPRCRIGMPERPVVRRIPGVGDRPDPGPVAPGPGSVGGPSRNRFLTCSTNLIDLDVIRGATPVLESALETIRTRARPQVLFVNCTCVPQLIGDDVEHAVRKAREAAPYPIVFKDQSVVASPFDRHIPAIRAAFMESAGQSVDPQAVNLVGFTAGRDRDDLERELGLAGIRVHRSVFPVVEPAVTEGFLQARVLVQYPHADWTPLYDRMFEGLDVRRVSPPAPLGFRDTCAFLETVAEAVGSDEAIRRIRRRAEAFRDTVWLPRVDEASGHRVGILCEQSRLRRLEGLDVLWGFPLVALLREMGFAVSMGIVPEEGCVRDVASEVVRWSAAGVDVSVVGTEEDASRWLRDPSIEAVFSDYYFDDRLVRTGHAPFSQRLFEKGFDGAVRTLDRIVDRCSAGVFRRLRHG